MTPPLRTPTPFMPLLLAFRTNPIGNPFRYRVCTTCHAHDYCLKAAEPYHPHFSGSGFHFRSAEIISGASEGVFGWITTNFLLGPMHGHANLSAPTFGALDMGGGSMQNTFLAKGTPLKGVWASVSCVVLPLRALVESTTGLIDVEALPVLGGVLSAGRLHTPTYRSDSARMFGAMETPSQMRRYLHKRGMSLTCVVRMPIASPFLKGGGGAAAKQPPMPWIICSTLLCQPLPCAPT